MSTFDRQSYLPTLWYFFPPSSFDFCFCNPITRSNVADSIANDHHACLRVYLKAVIARTYAGTLTRIAENVDTF